MKFSSSRDVAPTLATVLRSTFNPKARMSLCNLPSSNPPAASNVTPEELFLPPSKLTGHGSCCHLFIHDCKERAKRPRDAEKLEEGKKGRERGEVRPNQAHTAALEVTEGGEQGSLGTGRGRREAPAATE